MKRYLLILICVLLFSGARGQSVSDSIASRKYIQWLFDNKEYVEYKKEIFRRLKVEGDNDFLKLSIIYGFEIQNNMDSALFYYNTFFDHRTFEKEALLKKKLNLLILTRNTDGGTLQKGQPLLQEEERLKYRLSYHILNKEWKGAKHLYDSLKVKGKAVNDYGPIMEQINKPTKSPGLALAMSAIVPGSGKLYVGRLKDGITTLMFVGMFSWQSYVGFHKRGITSIHGWINGGFALGFHLGGIYGSYKAAKLYNKNKEQSIYNELYFYHKHSAL